MYIAGLYEYQGGATTLYYEGNALRRTGYATDNGVFYLLQDQLKSSSVLTNQNGTVNSRNYFYPYGGNRGSAAFSTLTTKRFTGQYHEAGLPGGEGLSYYGARWYDAQLGRFASPDTLVPGPGNPQAFNRYSYVFNNPLKLIDPSGHDPIGCASCEDRRDRAHGDIGGSSTPLISAWPSSSQFSEWNNPASIRYSGCFKCHAAVQWGRFPLTNAELAAVDSQMHTNFGLGVLAAIAGVDLYASGALAGLGSESTLERGAPELEYELAKAPQPHLQSPTYSGGANWFEMGTNDVGTTFVGPDRIVFTDNTDLLQEMGKRGPGIIIDGSHGGPNGEMLLEPRFFTGTQSFFNNHPMYNGTPIVDISQLAAQNIRTLGGPGQVAYVNWCWGGYCNLIVNNLTPPVP